MQTITRWLVVMTKPRMEEEAEEQLLRQGFETYLPRWVDLKHRKNQWRQEQAAMFPRYLFVRPSAEEQSIAPIRSTRGVSHLVRFGVNLAYLSERQLTDIKVLEEQRNTNCGQLNPFKKGDKVEITEGSFKGVSAEVLESDQMRVILLLQMLGAVQKLTFEAGFCQRI